MGHYILIVEILRVYMMLMFFYALGHIHKMVILFLAIIISFLLNLTFRRF